MYVMLYCLIPQSSELGCSGCANCVTILFDEIAPHLVTNNRYVSYHCAVLVNPIMFTVCLNEVMKVNLAAIFGTYLTWSSL